MSERISHLEIPRDVLESARITLPQLKIEIAILLYCQRRISLGKARELAGMSLWEFRQLLGSRQVETHFDVDDLAQDIATLRALEHR